MPSAGVFKNLLAMSRKPFLKSCGLFSPDFDLNWIPDVNTTTFTAPVESPDGARTQFSFDTPPKAVIFNGDWLFPSTGFSPSGSNVVFAVAPAADDIIWALL